MSNQAITDGLTKYSAVFKINVYSSQSCLWNLIEDLKAPLADVS